MSTGTNQERLEQNNELLEKLKIDIDNLPEAGGSGDNYSEDEQVIGTWIDGKPIYRKVVILTSFVSNRWNDKSHNIENLDKFIKIDGIMTRVDGVQNIIQRVDVATDWCCLIGDINTSKITIYVGKNLTGTLAVDNVRLIAEYTKTTN